MHDLLRWLDEQDELIRNAGYTLVACATMAVVFAAIALLMIATVRVLELLR